MNFWVGQFVRERKSGMVGSIQSIAGPYLMVRPHGSSELRTCFWMDLEAL